MCFQTEKAISDFGDKVSDSDKQEVSDTIEELRNKKTDDSIIKLLHNSYLHTFR